MSYSRACQHHESAEETVVPRAEFATELKRIIFYIGKRERVPINSYWDKSRNNIVNLNKYVNKYKVWYTVHIIENNK